MRPLRQQHLAVGPDQDSGSDANEFSAHAGRRALSAWAPARFLANCQATRPLRDPRCNANWSASRVRALGLARAQSRLDAKVREPARDRGKIVVLRERIKRDPQAEALRQRNLFLDRFTRMHFFADVFRFEVLAEIFGQQMAAIRRRVDDDVGRRRRRSSRRASLSMSCSPARRRRT